MSWLDKLNEKGWKVADDRMYNAFLGEYILGKKGEKKEKLVETISSIKTELSLSVNIVPAWYNV